MGGAKMIVGKNAAKMYADQKKKREAVKTDNIHGLNGARAKRILHDLLQIDPFNISTKMVSLYRDKFDFSSAYSIFESCREPNKDGNHYIFRQIEDNSFIIWTGILPEHIGRILSNFKNMYIGRCISICRNLDPAHDKEWTEFFANLKCDLASTGQVRKYRASFPEVSIDYSMLGVCRDEDNKLAHLNREWHIVRSGKYGVPRFAPIYLGNVFEKWDLGDSSSSRNEKEKPVQPVAPQTPAYRSLLLQSDNSRCRLKVYPEDILTDPNLGHWDLFCPKDGKECGKWYEIVELPENFKARNPYNDISDNAVAIDFGTTGTVVATRDEFGQISLLRIGAHEKSAGFLDASSHYVNPTVIQIDNIKNLLEAWRELPYRPNVSYEDAQSSHEAKETLNKNFERCLADLKTWARGKKNANAPIISDASKNELEISLAPTTSAADIAEDFVKLPLNPIELYAFFVGLYLNNQIVDGGRIFTEYYMTFPADFESESRKRILESFRRGFLRSLPPSLIYGSEWKPENLRVIERASEPVAYAAAILPLLGKVDSRQPAQEAESAQGPIIGEIHQIERDLKSKRNNRKKIVSFIQPLENKKRISAEEKQKLAALKQDLADLEKEISLKQDQLGEARSKLHESQGTALNKPAMTQRLEPSVEGVAFGVFDFGGGTTDIAIGLYRLPTEEEADAKGWERVVDILDTAGDSDLGGEKLVRRMVYEVVKENITTLNNNGPIPFERLPGYQHIPGDEELFAKSLIARENSWKLGEKLRPVWEKGKLENPENPDQVSETFKKSGGDAPNVILNVKVERLKKILKERIAIGVEKFFVTMGQAFKRENISPAEFHIVLAGNSARSPLVEECFREKIAEILGPDASEGENNKIILHPPLLPDENNPEAITLKTGVAIGLLHLLPGEPMGMVMRQRKGGEAPFAFTVGPLRKGKLEPVLKRNSNYGEWHIFGKVLEEGVSKYFYSASPLALSGELERSQCREGRLKWPVEEAGKTILVKAVAPDKIVFALQKNGANADEKTGQEITLKQ